MLVSHANVKNDVFNYPKNFFNNKDELKALPK